MYEFRYSTENCPDVVAFQTAHIMMYALTVAVIGVPVLGLILATGLTWLFDASVGSGIVLALASLVVTIPVAFFLSRIAKINTGFVFEATYGHKAPWDR